MIRASDVAIIEPCPADWGGMVDHGRFRHCAACDKPVYDFAQHTEAEIRALVAARVCRRIGTYEDGTIATRETPVVPASRLLRFARVAAIALPLAACDQGAATPSADPSVGSATPPTPSTTASASASVSASAAPAPPPAPSTANADCTPDPAAPGKHPLGKRAVSRRKVADWTLGSQR